jgi:hypothetical protein
LLPDPTVLRIRERLNQARHGNLGQSGHPVPNEAEHARGCAGLSLLESANRDHAPVIFLISGGGSAMFELPINEDIACHTGANGFWLAGASIRGKCSAPLVFRGQRWASC